MLIEMLSAEELDMMDAWRKDYVWNSESESLTSTYAEMASVLHEWDIQKSQYLFRLFGEQLKISKHLNYVKSYEEMQEELSYMMQANAHYGRARRNGHTFTESWNNYIYKNRYTFSDTQRENLCRLMSDDCLISNTYDGNSFEIETSDGKIFRINRGCKISKVLGKLADIFDLTGWEDFRICHSQILNQKTLGGTLTISIHPFDYMTMSDNDCDWESCMSWRNEGGYRQGTVEMMNSRSVVVAYLAAEDDMQITMTGHWNNKKWRQLFVVDHNLIAGVKDYPYHNEELGLEVMKWLKELAETNLKWSFMDPQHYTFSGKGMHLDYISEAKNDFTLEFGTNTMYNDFGCMERHWIAMSTNIDEDEIRGTRDQYRHPFLCIEYSGRSQCMVCGALNPNLSDESCLACEDCQDRNRCDCCGELNGEVWHVDGLALCSYCLENRVHDCGSCGSEHYDENMRAVYVIPRLNAAEQEVLKRSFIDNHPYWSVGFLSTKKELEAAEYNYFIEDTDIWICDNDDCFEKWINKNLNPGCRPHRRDIRWTKDIFVYYDELTPEAQEIYAWGFDGNAERYKESFSLRRAEPTRFIELL